MFKSKNIQWNPDITKCQGTGICVRYNGGLFIVILFRKFYVDWAAECGSLYWGPCYVGVCYIGVPPHKTVGQYASHHRG